MDASIAVCTAQFWQKGYNQGNTILASPDKNSLSSTNYFATTE